MIQHADSPPPSASPEPLASPASSSADDAETSYTITVRDDHYEDSDKLRHYYESAGMDQPPLYGSVLGKAHIPYWGNINRHGPGYTRTWGAFIAKYGKHYALDEEDIPRPTLEEVPVECELCRLHQDVDSCDFCHVHNVEFQDCFTFGPAEEGKAWYKVVRDSATNQLPPEEQRISRSVGKRHEALRKIALAAIRQALDDEEHSRPMPKLPRVLERPYPPGPLSPPKPPKPGRRRPPMWNGRSCSTCGLADDFGSYYHVHLERRGLCFTFGERGSYTLVKPGSTHFPLPDDEDEAEVERKRRQALQDRIEAHVRRAIREFYQEQNHIAKHRKIWKWRQEGVRFEIREALPEGETALRAADGRWKLRCCEEKEDYGYISWYYYFS